MRMDLRHYYTRAVTSRWMAIAVNVTLRDANFTLFLRDTWSIWWFVIKLIIGSNCCHHNAINDLYSPKEFEDTKELESSCWNCVTFRFHLPLLYFIGGLEGEETNLKSNWTNCTICSKISTFYYSRTILQKAFVRGKEGKCLWRSIYSTPSSESLAYHQRSKFLSHHF